MSRWFRLYDEVIHDPKVQKLSGEKFKAWINLLCLASANDGYLPPLADMAFALRLPEAKIMSLIGEFCRVLLLDVDETDHRAKYYPHNWKSRQYKSDITDPTAPERQKRYRDKKRDERNATVTVIRPESEQIQITESERKKDGAKAPVVELFPSEQSKPSEEKSYFDRFKEIAGPRSGGLAKKLLISQKNVISEARSIAERAASKSNPSEYIGAVIRGAAERSQTGAWGDDWGN